ncbi:MAG: kynureninase [Actinophytocola sp.]|nr:kynureninase [Actinophytocola sp.]
MATPTTRLDCAELDKHDPLAAIREEFTLPDDIVYLDGNSLGPLPCAARARVREMVDVEWGEGLIRSWNDAGWYDKPRTLGARIAPLVGARPDEVVVCDSTSINLFKVLSAALRLRPGRSIVVAEAGGFPTDLYIVEGATSTGYRRKLLYDGQDLAEVLDDDVAVVVLGHVDYRTGRLRDMARLTDQVHRAGALMIWDVCHSVGALPVRLGDCGVDFAVGCTYKYLNGGPGAPAFAFAAQRHQDDARHPLSGWHGHADPFAFSQEYRPAPGISRFLVGTPPVLSYAPLESSLDIWSRVDLNWVRAKSVAMTSLFLTLVEQECVGHGVEIASPRYPEERGSQVSLRHPDGYRIVQALIERGVIGDFRTPDVLRFGFTPLYLRYVDVWDAVAQLRDVLESGIWQEERFGARASVT